MIKIKLKKYRLPIVTAFLYLSLILFNNKLFINAIKISLYYLREMVSIMPVVFLLIVIIETWVKRQTIIDHLGKNSGLKGILYSFILGSFSAGPIYAAFPICKVLFSNGASIVNIVIIISSWAVIKVPMLINEYKFLGFKFMCVRWLLTCFGIIIIAYTVNKLYSPELSKSMEN